MPRKKIESVLAEETVIKEEPVAVTAETAPADKPKRGRKPGSTVKTAAKKAPAKKPAAKKAVAKKPATRAVKAPKAVLSANLYVEYAGKQISADEIVELVKASYTADGGAEEIKTLSVYVNVDDSAAYYVVNGIAEGKKIDL
ncbi:MAG: DUF6465 family protein [Oscillospiraceae bacterium]